MANPLRYLLGSVLFLLLPCQAFAARTVYSVFFPTSYYYVMIWNPSPVAQTISVRFESFGFTLTEGGAPANGLDWVGLGSTANPTYSGPAPSWWSWGGGAGIASEAVSCSGRVCTLKGKFTKLGGKQVLRLGVGSRREPSPCCFGMAYTGAINSIDTRSTTGVTLEITAAEDDGFLVANAIAYQDLSGTNSSADAVAYIPINAGRPF